MLFNSDVFIFAYLPLMLVGWLWALRASDRRVELLWLLAGSLVFYAWWKPILLPLLLTSILFNFATGHLLQRAAGGWRRLLLITGVTVNLGTLGWFKYLDFVLSSVSVVTGRGYTPLDIVLPLAISFFTFQQIAYIVDAYHGRAARYGLLNYALFVAFFPQLIAGPIVHHGELIPQFTKRRRSGRSRNVAIGLTIFVLGLCKKVILADSLGRGVDPIFAAAEAGRIVTSFEAWTATVAFTLQIYFDFSSYSDMAIGLARMFGILLPLNFDSPLKATSISELWRRWHITLSRFLGDYLFRPLGGMSRRLPRRCLALLLTMVLCGLWHGAGWTFVLWGTVQGVILVAEHSVRSLVRRRRRRPTGLTVVPALQCVATTLVFCLTLILFRAESVAGAGRMYAALIGPLPSGLHSELLRHAGVRAPNALAWPLIGLAVVWLCPNTQQIMGRIRPALRYRYAAGSSGLIDRVYGWLQWRPSGLRAALTAVLFVAALSAMSRAREFIYFQF